MTRYLLTLSLLIAAAPALAESLSFETYYPSPAGAYTNMTVSSNTALARDGAAVTVGSPLKPSVLAVNGGLTTRALTMPTGAAAGSVLTSDTNGSAAWQPLRGINPGYFPPFTAFTAGWNTSVQVIVYPVAVPAIAKGIIVKFHVYSGSRGDASVWASASNFPNRVVARAFSPNNNEDSASDSNTYIMPYAADRTLSVALSGSCPFANCGYEVVFDGFLF